MVDCSWKPNWAESKQHYTDWWNREGLVLSVWGWTPAESPHEDVIAPGPAASREDSYTNAEWRARQNHAALSRQDYPYDSLPIADTMIGPGSLALLVGSEPGFSPETVWFEPSIQDVAEPEKLPPFAFDPENRWWKVHEATARACMELARGKYMVGCPDLVENVDILAALRDPQTLMFDMIERPEWICDKMWEINQVWFDACQGIYDIIKLEDGGSAFACFGIWGPGKTAKVQCDACAMFSPDMFARFVVPALSEQCEWLDYSLYHLDGTQCICQLDNLLGIEALDAIEWTPQAGIEHGGSPRWHDLYRRILDAGKSVQVIGVRPDDLIPLLDAIGGKGVYAGISPGNTPPDELARVIERAEAYRD